MPAFSIIIPVRNGGEYIKELIHSILLQSHVDFNVLVLDNNSTDDTISWIQSIGDARIEIFPSGKSLSIEENWARIKTVPRNEFMTMIGHDDLLHPQYLEIMDKLIREHPGATLYQTHFDYINAKGDFVRNCLPMAEKQQAHEFLSSQMTRTIDSTGTGYMMRSADYDEFGGMAAEYSNLIFADFQLWMMLTRKGYKATSKEQGFSYRLHDSLSRTTNGMGYGQAFVQYIQFLIDWRIKDSQAASSINQHGKEFLLYYCESIAHRLLKTPIDLRTIKAGDFIRECEILAKDFIPAQEFKPLKKTRIRLAQELDKNNFGRALFRLAKKITG